MWTAAMVAVVLLHHQHYHLFVLIPFAITTFQLSLPRSIYVLVNLLRLTQKLQNFFVALHSTFLNLMMRDEEILFHRFIAYYETGTSAWAPHITSNWLLYNNLRSFIVHQINMASSTNCSFLKSTAQTRSSRNSFITIITTLT